MNRLEAAGVDHEKAVKVHDEVTKGLRDLGFGAEEADRVMFALVHMKGRATSTDLCTLSQYGLRPSVINQLLPTDQLRFK